MTREELKNALRPHISLNLQGMTPEYRREHIMPIAATYFASERSKRPIEEIFDEWNLTMIELLDEMKTTH